MVGLLELPAELRNQIYSHLLSPSNNRRPLGENYYIYNYAPSLVIFYLNRQIYIEARKIFHQINTFVRVSTPWEQAKHHVALDGQVNILHTSPRADKFTLQTMNVTINAFYPSPEANDEDQALFSFTILVEPGDLERFCRSWFYSSVTMPYLNAHLMLTLSFHDPYISSSPFPIIGEPHLPKQKQSMLLQPFSQIKGLREFRITGGISVYPSILKSVKAEMAVPLDSPEVCLQKATDLKDLGNTALTSGKFKEAIEHYNQAFEAIHIIIKGRWRRVYGDPYFDRTITTPGPFKDQHAGQARILLRVRLVANTVLAYLKLEDYDMAICTGMRTIKLMRSSIGLDEDEGATDPRMEAMSGFIAATEMGKIYYRTAMAFKAMDERTEARKLLAVAEVYLPFDKAVKEQVRSVALRLG